MRRLRSTAALALAFATSAGAVPRPVAAQEHVLRFADGLDLQTLNPLFATAVNVNELGSLTLAYFTRFDARGRPVPELITTIPSQANGGISRDGTSITYHLRRGVRWSDGAPFDASDVVYTVGAILNPSNNVTQRSAWDHIARVTSPDPYTVVFHLKGPFGPFAVEYFSSFSPSCILPKHILGSLPNFNTAPYNGLPVGIGPFRYTAFRRGDAVEMEANPYYFRGKPKLQKIVYKIITEDNTLFAQLQTGEIDLWAQVTGTFLERVTHVPNLTIVSTPSPFMAGIHLNVSGPILSDVRVRRALRYATDRAYVLRTANRGVGALAESVVPKVSQNSDASLAQAPYDPAQAARLLDAAGWKAGADGMRSKGGTPLALNVVLPSGYAPSQQTAELLRVMWGKVGIAVEVKTFADQTFFAPLQSGGVLESGRFDAALFSLSVSPYGDVSANFGCAYVPPRGFNFSRFCDRAADDAMQGYLTTYDPRRAEQLSHAAQRALDDTVPIIVTYERAFPYAFSSKVSGYHPTAFGPFDDMMNVDVSP